MENELKDILKKLENITEKMEINTMDKLEKEIDKSFNEPAILSIEKDSDGSTDVHLEGKAIPILITLAGLEKAIFEKLDVPNAIWEIVKEKTSIRDKEV